MSDTLHRWFDHHLQGVDNGIETEPAVTIEDEKDVWNDYAEWPVPGTATVNLFLRGAGEAAPGTITGSAGGGRGSTLSFVGSNSTSETNYMNSPEGAQTNRRVFLSPPLKSDVRLSGRAQLDLLASLSTDQSDLGVLVVDYSAAPFDMVTRGSERVRDTATRTCWGAAGEGRRATSGRLHRVGGDRRHRLLPRGREAHPVREQSRVTRGTLDSSNRDSLWYQAAQPVTIGQQYEFSIPTMPTEHTFKAGHRIGVVVTGHLFGNTAAFEGGRASTNGSVITMDAKSSKLSLPVVGGRQAALAAGLF